MSVQSICPSVCLYVCLCVCLCPPLSLEDVAYISKVRRFFCLSVCLCSLSVSVCLFPQSLSSVSLSVCPSCLSVSLCLHLLAPLCVSLSLSFFSSPAGSSYFLFTMCLSSCSHLSLSFPASPCSRANGGCTSICVERPHSASQPLPLNRTCLCSELFDRISQSAHNTYDEQCACGSQEVVSNGTCAAAKGQFQFHHVVLQS